MSILEEGCPFNFSLEEAFLMKALKYQPLVSAMEQLGYKCKLFGSLGDVHRLVLRGLASGRNAKIASKAAPKISLCISNNR